MFSCSKRWYDDTKDNNVNCSIEYSKLPGFTFVHTSGFMFEEMISEKIERGLTIIQIYHLNIFQKNFSIPVLIQLIHLLPDLIILKIHSVLLDNTTELTMEEVLIFGSKKVTRKITKVYVEEIGSIRQLNFLFALCPIMEYFKVRCINTMDVQSFLHTIFKNINRNNDYHHLRSLCVHVPTADDRVVERIAYMMKCEKLVHHFTVKLVLDDIYLQAK